MPTRTVRVPCRLPAPRFDMYHLRIVAAIAAFLLLSSASVVPVDAQRKLTSPKEQWGHDIGDDYFLANYTQLTEYWKKLAKESDRLQLLSIGKTAEGRDQWMTIVTAPENFKKLDHYRNISRRLALAEGLTDDEARSLAKDGKAVVWIDGGLHATEVLGAHQLMETVYQLASRTDDETQRFLRDAIILCVQANPDGMELVSNWYMRDADSKKRSTDGVQGAVIWSRDHVPRAASRYVQVSLQQHLLRRRSGSEEWRHHAMRHPFRLHEVLICPRFIESRLRLFWRLRSLL